MSHDDPIYLNEDYLENPEQLWRAIRQGFRERQHRRLVQQLPPELSLAELRRSCAFSQITLAARLSTDQARLSRQERSHNPRLAWLRAYVAALGGTLHLLARFPDRDVRITDAAGAPARARASLRSPSPHPPPGFRSPAPG